MAELTLNVTGLADLRRSLEGLDTNLRRKMERKGIRAAAKVIEKQVRLNLQAGDGPRKTERPRGRLARALKVRSIKRSRTQYGVQARFGDKWFVGKSFYAGFQEYGWRSGSRRREKLRRTVASFSGAKAKEGLDKRKKQPGKAMVRAAFQAKSAQAFRTYVDATTQALRQLWSDGRNN